MVRAIVTDIEGTTTSLSFVKDVLFPYSTRHLPGFVRSQGHRPEVRQLLDEARKLAGGAVDDEGLVGVLLKWIETDQKLAPLKGLQGLLWEEGYRQGAFQGHVYEDATRRLREWHQQGLRLYVYSSGSEHAQRLIFGHTPFGDLTPLFSGYFDTRVGGKKEAPSYAAIVRELGLPATCGRNWTRPARRGCGPGASLEGRDLRWTRALIPWPRASIRSARSSRCEHRAPPLIRGS